jgi:hypothetical protein
VLAVLDPDVVPLDPLAVLAQVREPGAGRGLARLVVEQGELGLALHVRLAGEDEDHDRPGPAASP